MRKTFDPMTDPLPAHRRKWLELKSWWVRSRNRRQKARRDLWNAGQKATAFAFQWVGGTLISFGAYQMYSPAGYVVGGLICWLLLWSGETDRRRRSG